jgi:hypothetical protein
MTPLTLLVLLLILTWPTSLLYKFRQELKNQPVRTIMFLVWIVIVELLFVYIWLYYLIDFLISSWILRRFDFRNIDYVVQMFIYLLVFTLLIFIKYKLLWFIQKNKYYNKLIFIPNIIFLVTFIYLALSFNTAI